MTLTADQRETLRAAARAELIKRGELKPKIVDLEREPSVDGLPFHDGQRRAWNSARRYVAVFAGWRSGKTEIGPWWLLREIQRVGPGDYALIAPTFPLLDNKARPALKRAIIQAMGASAYHSSGDIWTITDAGCMQLWGHVPNVETRILFRHGKDENALEAFDGKGLWLDEPGQMDDSIWDAAQARVSIGQYRMLLTSRPYRWNFYVTKIWNAVCDAFGGRREDADPMMDCINFRSIDNPAFSVEEYERQRGLIPDWLFELKFNGLPTRPAGIVYDCFDSDNIVEPFEVPRAWPLYLGLDFGLINTAGVIIAEELKKDWLGHWTDEPTGNYYLIGTYHAGQSKTAKEHLRAVRDIADSLVMGGAAQRPTAVGGSHMESGWRESWSLSGLGVAEPSILKVDSQIACLYAAFKTKKLKVFRTCSKFIEEAETFAYELDDAGEPTEKFDDTKFHRLSGARYIATRLFKTVERSKAPTMKAGFGLGQE